MSKAKKNPTAAKIYTIGFTKKSAEQFFELLELHDITNVIDVRLYNNTQLSGFAKSADLKFFLKRISAIEYKHDLKFTPAEKSLNLYKRGLIDWEDYVKDFETNMNERRIVRHITQNYSDSPEVRYCLLCAEPSANFCQRRLVAEKFAEVFDGMEIIHL